MSRPDHRRHFLKAAAMSSLGVGAVGIAGVSAAGSQAAAGRLAQGGTLREQLLACLGGPWPEPCELKPEVIKVDQRDGYRLEWVRYEVEPDDGVPAILIVPDGVSSQSPAAAIAVWHQHAGQWHLGKSEPAGLAGDSMHHTGIALAKLGYVVLCPDALCFEERRDQEGKLKGGDFERFEFLRYVVNGQSMAWKNILDMRRAIDYLDTRPEVNADKLGCYGHSMGSTHTWLVGPWEPRLKCLVGNCCLPTYAAIERTKLLHCFPNFIPGFHQFGRHARPGGPDRAAAAASQFRRARSGLTDRGSASRRQDDRGGLRRSQRAGKLQPLH